MKKFKLVSIIVNLSMILVLIPTIVTPYLLESRFGTLTRADQFLGWNAGNWHQNLGWVFAFLAVIHVILNLKWLKATIKNFAKVNKVTKAQLIICLLLVISMVACIWSGARWGALGRNVTDAVRMVHTLSAWATMWIMGIHMGVNCSRFMAFFDFKKPKA